MHFCFSPHTLAYLYVLMKTEADAIDKDRRTNTLLGTVDPLDVNSQGH